MILISFVAYQPFADTFQTGKRLALELQDPWELRLLQLEYVNYKFHYVLDIRVLLNLIFPERNHMIQTIEGLKSNSYTSVLTALQNLADQYLTHLQIFRFLQNRFNMFQYCV